MPGKRDNGYDEEKDHLLKHVERIEVAGTALDITVDIKRWEDGPPRIRVNRVGEKKDASRYVTKLGSLSAVEAEQLAPVLAKAAVLLREIEALAGSGAGKSVKAPGGKSVKAPGGRKKST